jgi:hypothetical protein
MRRFAEPDRTGDEQQGDRRRRGNASNVRPPDEQPCRDERDEGGGRETTGQMSSRSGRDLRRNITMAITTRVFRTKNTTIAKGDALDPGLELALGLERQEDRPWVANIATAVTPTSGRTVSAGR